MPPHNAPTMPMASAMPLPLSEWKLMSLPITGKRDSTECTTSSCRCEFLPTKKPSTVTNTSIKGNSEKKA